MISHLRLLLNKSPKIIKIIEEIQFFRVLNSAIQKYENHLNDVTNKNSILLFSILSGIVSIAFGVLTRYILRGVPFPDGIAYGLPPAIAVISGCGSIKYLAKYIALIGIHQENECIKEIKNLLERVKRIKKSSKLKKYIETKRVMKIL